MSEKTSYDAWRHRRQNLIKAHKAADKYIMKRWWYEPLLLTHNWGHGVAELTPEILSRGGMIFDKPTIPHDPTVEDEENKRLTMCVVYKREPISILDNLSKEQREFILGLIEEERHQDDEKRFNRNYFTTQRDPIVRTEKHNNGEEMICYHKSGKISTLWWTNTDMPPLSIPTCLP